MVSPLTLVCREIAHGDTEESRGRGQHPPPRPSFKTGSITAFVPIFLLRLLLLLRLLPHILLLTYLLRLRLSKTWQLTSVTGRLRSRRAS